MIDTIENVFGSEYQYNKVNVQQLRRMFLIFTTQI